MTASSQNAKSRPGSAARRKPSPRWDSPLISCANGHAHCLLCGDQNPWSLRLQFLPEGKSEVRTRLQAHQQLQGYEGIIHGGVLAALLDAAMTHCLFHEGILAVTAELRVRYRRPVPVDVTLDVRAWLVSGAPRLHVLKAEIEFDGQVAVVGEAKFIRRVVASDRTST